MKFDTPPPPIRSTSSRSSASRAAGGWAAQDHRHGALCLRAPRRGPRCRIRLCHRRGALPRGASPPWTWARRAPRRACWRSSLRANAGKLGKGEFNTAKLLGGPGIDHYHQAVAVVVASTFEQARAAAQSVRISYEVAPGKVRPGGRKGGRQGTPGHRILRPTGYPRRATSPARSPRRQCSWTPSTRRPIRPTP